MDIYLYEKSTKILNIVERTPNDGLYFWKVPNTLQESSFYRILIIDSEDTMVYDWSDEFEIIGLPENSESDEADNDSGDSTSYSSTVSGFNMIFLCSLITITLIFLIIQYKIRLGRR